MILSSNELNVHFFCHFNNSIFISIPNFFFLASFAQPTSIKTIRVIESSQPSSSVFSSQGHGECFNKIRKLKANVLTKKLNYHLRLTSFELFIINRKDILVNSQPQQRHNDCIIHNEHAFTADVRHSNRNRERMLIVSAQNIVAAGLL